MTELSLDTNYSFPLWVDNTAITDFKSCKKKSEWATFFKLEPNPGSVHLHAGKAFARGLEVARKAFYVEGLDEELAVGQGLMALWKEYGDYETPEDSYKSWLGMTHAFIHYMTEWKMGEDYITPLPIGDKKAIEFSFAIPIEVNHPETGDPILLSGRADMFAEYQNSAWVEDDKTTKGIGPQWANQWPLRGQFMGYTWAGREYGHKLKGAIVRAVSVQKTQNKVAEAIIPISDSLLDKWYTSLIFTVKEMIRAWENKEFPHDFGHACSGFGGCDYAQLCLKNDPSKWLMYYKERTWNPMEDDHAA